MNHLFAGRFQPFHNGHLQVIDAIFNVCSTQLWLLVVRGVSDIETDAIGAEHFVPKKNPFPLNTTVGALQEISVRLQKKFIPIIVPQPSSQLGFQCIKCVFPENRIWYIPDSGDPWDDKKADHYLALGEKVVRISAPRLTTGTRIRELASSGRFNEIGELVPKETLRLIKQFQ